MRRRPVGEASAQLRLSNEELLKGGLASKLWGKLLDDDKLPEAPEADPAREEDLRHPSDRDFLQDKVLSGA